MTLSHIFNVLQAILDQVDVKMNSNVDFILHFQRFRYVMLTLSHISNVLLTIMHLGAPTCGRHEVRVQSLGLYLYTAAQGVVAQLIPHCCGWAVELKLSLTMSV